MINKEEMDMALLYYYFITTSNRTLNTGSGHDNINYTQTGIFIFFCPSV